MPVGTNETSIVLIPKKDNPELLKDSRPISLCNVVYKVVSKCLVNRLQPILQDVIAPTQSAFIPSWLITDNAPIAFECLHANRNGSSICKKFGAYKLDLTKAYDRVDWSFLEGVLYRLGFHQKWIQWAMVCVTTVQYLVRFNNVQLEPFTLSRGLWQGDPLSPYLFLFVADGLSQILQHEVQSGVLHELRICRQAPRISHLLFADDTMLFLEAIEQHALIVDKVLRMYERCTGQLINPSKCSIMFGSDCSESGQEVVKNVLKVENIVVDEKYLGLPTPEGRLNKDKFMTMKERLMKRFTNWAERNMSSGAKEVLIKSVARSIPTYSMGVFKLSATLCHEMTRMIRNFWWGEEAGHRKVHWIAWENMLMPKAHGGIG
jgi:hypothetical protein